MKASRFFQSLELPDILDLIAVLTLVLLMIHSPQGWYARGPIMVLCIFGLAFPKYRQRSGFWWLVSCFLAAVLFNLWFWLDNHKYLEFYWVLCMALMFGLPKEQQKKFIEINASLLLAGCMLLAVLWKLITIDYMSGAFFEYTLLTDKRFETFTSLVGWIPDADLFENRTALNDLEGPGALPSVTLLSTVYVGWLAQFMTYWTVIIESAIGLLFLFSRKSDTIRTAAFGVLIVFIISTYAIATVKGFGWLLILFGLAQTRETEKPLRVLLIALFLLIQIYTLPVGQLGEAIGFRSQF